MNRVPDIKAFISGLNPDAVKGFASPVCGPAISVVIPTFNQGEFLERTILSILNQAYSPIELIIIDGGSTDNTSSVVNRYSDYISTFISELDRGQGHALNKGFALATGDIFCWQNSDDVFLPNVFKTVGSVFAKFPYLTVCYGNWLSIDEQDKLIDIHYSLRPRVPHTPYENMDAYNQSLFWRRAVHERFGGFDERLHMLMDDDLITHFLLTEKPERFCRIDAFLGAFRRHGAQKTDVERMDNRQREEEMIIEDKYGFPSANSIAGKYYRLRYRLSQFFESIYFGGFAYTLHKFKVTYCRRGRFF